MVNWFVLNAEAGPVRVGFHVNFFQKREPKESVTWRFPDESRVS